MELFPPLNSRENFLKYCAFKKPFFINKNKKRNIVSKGFWDEKEKNFIIQKIIPENKKEKNYIK